MGFMYFSEIDLKLCLSILDFYLEKSKYIWAIATRTTRIRVSTIIL